MLGEMFTHLAPTGKGDMCISLPKKQQKCTPRYTDSGYTPYYADSGHPFPELLSAASTHPDRPMDWTTMDWGTGGAFFLRHACGLVILAEASIGLGTDATMDDVFQRLRDQNMLGVLHNATWGIDGYCLYMEHFINDDSCLWAEMTAASNAQRANRDVDSDDCDAVVLKCGALPWYATVYTSKLRDALQGADVAELTRLYEVAVEDCDGPSHMAILRRVAEVGEEADVDALSVIMRGGSDDCYDTARVDKIFANAKSYNNSLVARARWSKARQKFVTMRSIALYWGAQAARPDASGNPPAGALAAFVSDF